ncbi:DHA1 family bicyclomycin/chloramphenicol resistance-like MFS transporter [Sphingomonas vulcanisoli]|uniref:Bcr/CflA family efflux transporter n=1 Tax=Sphingomonas vulcanisoli TaxID=1658060 RepID=A0ABX0TR78_9SPHN|nr:multidrug effflux MFS transporter [Sphingomonas vulcanisoli]NIJ08032.1 DHA1 family bicyclomycin/chloramphenicol resistance-like MFS transporter [Sphingomonas vulcanisoli]
MIDAARSSPGGSDPGLSFGGFVALMAGLMAMNALGIDSMLPALPAIAQSLHIAAENQRQWVISAYVIGFGVAQIGWGSFADAYGRKPIVVASLLLFALFSLIIVLVPSFTVMLIARFLQGIAASASRVLVSSIVRDCYSGRRMARVMSLSFIVFLAVPILAPGIGSAILMLGGSWRMIFLLLGAYGFITAAIVALRLRETLHPEYRRALSFGGVGRAMERVVTNRMAIGYTLVGACSFGAILGFINSIEQIVTDILHAQPLFPIIFASIAAAMGVAAYLNSRLVERLGTRRISHAALLCFTCAGGLHLLVALSGHETLFTFILLQALTQFFVGLMGSNFNSMAMESMGDIAGTAASVQGFISTCLAAVIGLAIGQSFNGTTVPMSAGFLVLGLLSIVIVLFAEKGKLFRPQHSPVTQ